VSRRYALLGVALVLAVFAFEYYFLRPGAELLRGRVHAAYAVIQKDERYLKAAAATGEDIQAVSREVEVLEKRLIPEKSEFLAAAKLQGEVSDLAAKAGLKVLTIRPLAPSKVNDYRSIPLYFEGSGSIMEISEFLRSIEADILLIKIDKLGLNITNMQNPKDLKFKIQVSGLAKI
jgi:Tfp pilus assembly protein PilO